MKYNTLKSQTIHQDFVRTDYQGDKVTYTYKNQTKTFNRLLMGTIVGKNYCHGYQCTQFPNYFLVK